MTETGLQHQHYHSVTASSRFSSHLPCGTVSRAVPQEPGEPEMEGVELSKWCERGTRITERTHRGKLSLQLEPSGGPRGSEWICPGHQGGDHHKEKEANSQGQISDGSYSTSRQNTLQPSGALKTPLHRAPRNSSSAFYQMKQRSSRGPSPPTSPLSPLVFPLLCSELLDVQHKLTQLSPPWLQQGEAQLWLLYPPLLLLLLQC